MESRTYEFNATENSLIKDLAQKMRFVSYFLITIGAVLLASGSFNLNRGGIALIVNGAI